MKFNKYAILSISSICSISNRVSDHIHLYEIEREWNNHGYKLVKPEDPTKFVAVIIMADLAYTKD